MEMAVTAVPWTVEEFDRCHATQPDQWELMGGVPVKVARPTKAHTIIRGNIALHLGNKLAGSGSRVYINGVQVKERRRGLCAIPDIVVDRLPPDFSSPEVKQPIVIVEIVPPPGEDDDTGVRWRGYRLNPSLQHFLVVGQAEPMVEVHTRIGSSSFAEEFTTKGDVELTALGVTLTLDEFYEAIPFPESPEPPDA
jgi:Uma2 family endonuclease